VAQNSSAEVLDLNVAEGLVESFLFKDSGIHKSIRYQNFQSISSFHLSRQNIDLNDPFSAWWLSFLDSENKFEPQVEFGEETCTYIDLFSSVGGLSLGFEQACKSMGIQPIPLLAVDIDGLALKIHKANHHTQKILNDSVSSLIDFKVIDVDGQSKFAYAPELVGNMVQGMRGKVDVIIAGPPCQGYSTLNNHSRGDDPRNLLYLTVPAIAIALGAKHVIIENVPNVVNSKESVVKKALDLLIGNGYKVTSGVLHADKLGWPQTRKRFFIVASLENSPISLETIKVQYQRKSLPVTWAISNFEVAREEKSHLMNQLAETSEENLSRINWLFDNEEFELPNHERPECHRDGHTYPSVYGRMRPNDPAPTLTTGFMSPGRGRFIHPTERRVLTPREGARLQGFPNWFDFTPDSLLDVRKTDLAKWIGDAVPSILGYFATLSLAPNLMRRN
jgi:DNA (cytosine-5)-methyltransferase 1